MLKKVQIYVMWLLIRIRYSLDNVPSIHGPILIAIRFLENEVMTCLERELGISSEDITGAVTPGAMTGERGC